MERTTRSFMQTELLDKLMGTVLIIKNFQNMFHYADVNLIQYIKDFCCLTFVNPCIVSDRLCGLVVRVSGYRYRGLGFDSRRYQIF